VTYVAPVLGLLVGVVGTADVFLALDPSSLSLRKGIQPEKDSVLMKVLLGPGTRPDLAV
jgi:hypothetical protein